MKIELFKLMGRILINSDEADASLSKIDSKAEKTGGTFGKLGGAASAVGGLLAGAVAAGAAAAAAGIGGLFIASDNMTKALNGLQASTGATDEEMKGMEESLKSIYKNNYGESFEDIAQSMANVKQATGATGAELEKMTQTALMMRDTFGFEVNESINTVDKMMKNFGITADEAFTLLAQGQQKGLNASDDMLDTFTEYSPIFKQLGFDAEGMFNILADGAANGVRNTDVLADAVKEFGIRVKDGSTLTAESFAGLGLNADEMAAKFAQGGQSAQDAFSQTMAALGQIEDPIERNTIGVGLFGTKFEDLEHQAVLSLGNVENVANQSGDTLAKINEIKYDSFGEALQGIGRNLLMGVFEPFQQRVMPIVNEFANWMTDKMPVVEQVAGDTFNAFLNVVTKLYEFYKVNLLPIFTQFYTWIQSNMPTIRATGETVLNSITDYAKTLWKFFKENILPIFVDLYNWIQGHMPTIRATAETAFNKITEVVRNAWAFFKENLLPILASVYGWVQAHMPQIKSIIETAFKAVKNVVEIAWGIFENLLLPVLKALWDWVEPHIPKIKETISKAMDGVVGAVELVVEVFEKVTGAIKTAIDWLSAWNDKPAKKKTVEVEEKRIGGGIAGDIPNHYVGDPNFQGGLTWAGEHGPELLNLPKGTKIHSANDSSAMAKSSTNVFNVSLNLPESSVRSLGDLIAFFNQLPQAVKAR